MGILVIALQEGIYTETKCDYFTYKVKSNGSKLPFNSIKEYVDFK
jgi:hypothetical protein